MSTAVDAAPLQDPRPVYCLCRGPDEEDRPMIACDGECEDWYHWDCVGLDEIAYEDVEDYICPTCEAKTGKKTTRRPLLLTPPAYPIVYPSIQREDANSDDGDDLTYSDFPRNKTGKGVKKKGRLRPPSESDSDDEEVTKLRPKARSKSTRRSSAANTTRSKPPPSSSSSTPVDDPIRRACTSGIVDVLSKLLNDEIKAKAYGKELEGRVWLGEGAGEGDAGRKKYLDRMRSLRFNVSKVDRKELRKGIIDGIIVPEMLSKMSSNELANPSLQKTYQSAAEDGLRTRLLPSNVSSKSAPIVVHNHKGVVEVEPNHRDDMEKEEEEARREGEERKRKRTREEEVERKREESRKKKAKKESASLIPSKSSSTLASTSSSASASNVNVSQPASASSSDPSLAPTLSTYSHTPFSLDDFLPDDSQPSSYATNGSSSNAFHSDSPFFYDLPPSSHLSGGFSPEPEGDDEGGGRGPMMDFWVDGDVAIGQQARNATMESEEEMGRRKMQDLFKREPIWRGSIVNPDSPISGTLTFIPLFFPTSRTTSSSSHPLSDFPTTSLLPNPAPPSLSIVGRVPIEPSRKFLHQAQLSPSKEVIVVLIEGSEEDGGMQGLEGLRGFLTGRGRDALIHPHTAKGPLPLDGARELYVVIVKQSDPLPDFLESLNDELGHPLPSDSAGRGKDLAFGVFVRNRALSAVAEDKGKSKGKAKGEEREALVAGGRRETSVPPAAGGSTQIASLLANLSSIIPTLPGPTASSSSAAVLSTNPSSLTPNSTHPTQPLQAAPALAPQPTLPNPSTAAPQSSAQAYLQSRLQHTQHQPPYSTSSYVQPGLNPSPYSAYGQQPIPQQQSPLPYQSHPYQPPYANPSFQSYPSQNYPQQPYANGGRSPYEAQHQPGAPSFHPYPPAPGYGTHTYPHQQPYQERSSYGDAEGRYPDRGGWDGAEGRSGGGSVRGRGRDRSVSGEGRADGRRGSGGFSDTAEPMGVDRGWAGRGGRGGGRG